MTLLDTLMFRRVALHDPAHLAERRAVIDEAIELANRMGLLEAATGARIVRAMELIESGDVAAADADVEVAEQEGRAFRLTSLSTLTPLYYRAMRTTMSGRLADGEKLTLEAYEAMHTAGYPNTFLVLMMQLYQLRWLQGRLAEVEPTVAELVAHYPDLPPGMVGGDGSPPSGASSGNAVGVVEAEWRLAWAHVLCETGRLDEARVQFDLAAANDFDDVPFDNVWTTAMIVGAEACAVLGDVRRAQLLYDKLLPYADQFNLLGPLLTCGGAIARTLGQLATVLGRWTEAEAHLDAALAANRGAGAVPFVVLTQRDQARMLLARGEPGDRERADRLLLDAGVTARELGMMAIGPMSDVSAPPRRRSGAR
jgi:tetratricopeptide (TPR) repeat protein